MELLAFTFSPEIAVIGLFTGLAYALLAAGLVLLYRATRVINFAYGEIGAFGAAVLAKLVLDFQWNFFLTFALMVVMGGIIGGVIELGVVRRLFEAPRLILLVATIGVAQVMFFAKAILPGIDRVAPYPSPINRTMRFGDLVLRSEHFMVLAFVPSIIVALTYFLTRTHYGIAIRASAENAAAARLAGISVRRVSTMVWVISGSLTTATAILIAPLRGTIVGSADVALGPGLLLRALAAGLVGRLISLPWALAGGLVIGVTEAVLLSNVREPGVVDGALLVIVLGLVLFRGQSQEDNEGSWSLTPKVRAVPARLRQIWWVRHMGVLGGTTALAVAIVLPQIFTTSDRVFLFSRVVLFAIIALSVTILTGWAGQLSLGQFAFVGLGSLTTAALHAKGMPFGVAVFYSTVAGVLAALAIGAPALRIKGMWLAVTTLAFAVAARGWFFTRDVFLDGGTVVFVPRPKLGPLNFESQRTYYYLCLLVLVVTVACVARVRATGIGRSIIAVQNNEPSAASFTVSPAIAKLTAFALAGGLAALAGALLAGLRVQFGADAFGPEESLRVVAMTIIGGLGSVTGALLGAVYVLAVPIVFGDSLEVQLLTSGTGLLILLLYFPGGLVQIVYKLRDLLLSRAEKTLAAQPPSEGPAAIGARVAVVSTNGHRPPIEVEPGAPVLRATDVTVRFGGLVALDSVTIEARRGEAVGLIGSNGAGKSTLMNVISGFLTPADGTIEILGHDVTNLPAHERARLGVGRVFQDARLFGDLTVRESVQVALEARERSELIPSLLSLPPSMRAERRKLTEADELVDFLGLGRYADAFISGLSTGTRRIAELACLLALEPRILLLDEPTAGVAQRETEAFGPLLKRIQGELDATLVIIEHDMPLVLSISDRVYCLAAGREICEGPPADVRVNPKVIAAYLGTDERAIQRSGAAMGAKT